MENNSKWKFSDAWYEYNSYVKKYLKNENFGPKIMENEPYNIIHLQYDYTPWKIIEIEPLLA